MANLTTGKKNAAKPSDKAAEEANKAAAQQIAEAAKRNDQPSGAFETGAARIEASEDEKQQRWTAIAVFATQCGEQLSSDKKFVEFEQNTITWKKELDYKAVYCMKFMQKNLTKEQLNKLPWPKSTEKDVKGNEMFDSIKVYETNNAGENKLIATTFYREMAKATPEGKRAAQEIRNLKVQTGEAGLPDRKSEESGHRTDLNTLVNAMETAGKILIQEYLLSFIEDVQWQWIKGADGEIKKTPKCIMAWSPSNMQTMDYHTISQFISWRLHKVIDAKKKGIIAVRASVKKKAAKAPVNASAKKFEQMSLREMTDAMSQALSFYAKGNIVEQGKRFTEWSEMLGRSDEDKITVVSLYRMLKPLCEHNQGELMRLADQASDRIKAAIEAKKAS